MRSFALRSIGAVLMACAMLAACDAHKDDASLTVEEFYKGRVVTIIVGASSGGGYDVTSRMIARHLSAFIPGHPQIIVQNMPGAGSLLAANHVFEIAPKDGTVIGVFYDAVPLAPLWKFEGARFDPLEVNWLGPLASRDHSVIVVRSDAPATTIQGAMQKQVALGSAGSNSVTSAYPLLLNELIGTKFKIVTGYPGDAETMLAIERGEVSGRAATNWNTILQDYPDLVAQKKILPMLQLTINPIEGMDNVPRALDFAKNEQDRELMRVVLGNQQYARIYAMAPGVHAERLAAVRKAWAEMANDPAFVAEMRKMTNDTVHFTPPEEFHAFLKEAYSLPQALKDRAAQHVGGD